jgi:hypothetical protein
MRTGFKTGQGLVDYALLLMLIGIIIIVLLTAFGQSMSRIYVEIVHKLGNVTGTLAVRLPTLRALQNIRGPAGDLVQAAVLPVMVIGGIFLLHWFATWILALTHKEH